MRELSVINVVSLDVLLEVLSNDARPVAERVHRLLLPSYFAGPEEGPACMAALLRQSPEVPTLTEDGALDDTTLFISNDSESTILVCIAALLRQSPEVPTLTDGAIN